MNQHDSHEPDPDQRYDADVTDHDEADESEDASTESGRTVPPFHASQLERALALDALLRWSVVLVVALGLGVAIYLGLGGATAAVLSVVLVMGGWLLLNVSSARVSRELPELAAMIDSDPDAAEDQLARLLRVRPLLSWVRLMLYHRLAGLRHRQQRFDESLRISAAVLHHPLGPAREARPHLLLMLSEAAIEQRDLFSAYHALHQLYLTRLSLTEALQRLALQMRYEVMCGYHGHALYRSGQKIQLAELMPAAQCGAVHAILAEAASQTDQSPLAQWLWQRAELLCTPDQLSELRGGGLGTGIVESAGPASATSTH